MIPGITASVAPVAVIPGGGITVDPSWLAFRVDANTVGATAAGLFRIPTNSTTYNIQWEEVGAPSHNSGGAIAGGADYEINFGVDVGGGQYDVYIDPVTGGSNFARFRFNNAGDKLKLISLSQWGTTVFNHCGDMFSGCSNFIGFTATDAPILTGAFENKLENMFAACSAMTTTNNIQNWSLSTITNLRSMFNQCSLANPDVSTWDVSNVGTLYGIFYDASVCDPDTTSWVTSSATDMGYMFRRSGLTSKDFTNFNVVNVTTMNNMFDSETLSTTDYDALLIGWEGQPLTISGVSFDAGASKYTAGGAAATARANLIADHGWIIVDGGTA